MKNVIQSMKKIFLLLLFIPFLLFSQETSFQSVYRIDAKYYRTYQRMGKLNNVLLSVKNKGFVLKLPGISRKGTGFTLRFYATNKESENWEYQLVEENKKKP